MLEDLRILSHDDMEGRDTGSPGGERARDYIVSRLEALGVEAPLTGRLQPWSAPNRSRIGAVSYDGVNVIGLIRGTARPDRYIVVTAHYDHMGTYEGRLYNGADDNASGVASMLELAARLKAEAPAHSVLFVALDGEERGLLGADQFRAASARAAGVHRPQRQSGHDRAGRTTAICGPRGPGSIRSCVRCWSPFSRWAACDW